MPILEYAIGKFQMTRCGRNPDKCDLRQVVTTHHLCRRENGVIPGYGIDAIIQLGRTTVTACIHTGEIPSGVRSGSVFCSRG